MLAVFPIVRVDSIEQHSLGNCLMVLSLIEVIGLTVKLCIELLIINLASVANARRILVPGHHVFGKHGLVEHLALWVLRLELFLSKLSP